MSEPERGDVATRFQHGNSASVVHGSTAEGRIRPVARLHRRRVLRQLGLRANDLDPIAKGYLDIYTRLMAKIELADQYMADHGVLKGDGQPQAVLAVYSTWVNSARLTLARLDDHLRVRDTGSPTAALTAYLHEAYGDADAS